MEVLLYTITELSKKSGVSRQHIYAIKQRKVNAKLLTLQKLAKVLNCEVLQVVDKLNNQD